MKVYINNTELAKNNNPLLLKADWENIKGWEYSVPFEKEKELQQLSFVDFSFEYYYRRFNKFFFRRFDEKIEIVLNEDSEIFKCFRSLKKGQQVDITYELDK